MKTLTRRNGGPVQNSPSPQGVNNFPAGNLSPGRLNSRITKEISGIGVLGSSTQQYVVSVIKKAQAEGFKSGVFFATGGITFILALVHFKQENLLALFSASFYALCLLKPEWAGKLFVGGEPKIAED